MRRGPAALLAVIVVAGAGCSRSAPPDAASIEANNRAVGLMGMFRYEDALEVFGELVERHGDWTDVRVNLAIATLNRQNVGDEDLARELLAEALEADPTNLRARYCLGLLLLRAGEQAALGHLQAVVEADPDDPYAKYFFASVLERAGRVEEALALYLAITELDPYLRSAYYRASQLLLRAGERERGTALHETFMRLDTNPQARTVDFIYTKMGPKAEALAVNLPVPAPRPAPSGPLFGEARPLLAGDDLAWVPTRPDRAASVTACDVDGDGDLDLFIAGALETADGVANAVLLNDGRGEFSLAAGHELANEPGVNAALWGDWDNDGLTDVFFCASGPNQLWRQTSPGTWTNVTEAAQIAGFNRDTVDGAFVDADHDGDLDVFCVNADSPNELLINNRDGTFRAIAAERGLGGGYRVSRQVLFADLDTDRDADIVVVNDEPPHEVYRNDRQWAYTPATGMDALLRAPIRALASADADADGQVELYAIDHGGQVLVWSPDAAGVWSSRPLYRPGGGSGPALRPLAVADLTGSGIPELLAATNDGWLVISMRPEMTTGPASRHFADASGGRPAGLVPVVIDVARGPAVVAVPQNGPPAIWPAGAGRHPFTSIELRGADDPTQSMRSNLSAIGARLAMRADSRWSATDTFRHGSGPGQGLVPVSIGLDDARALDFVAIHWPDGVFQSEVNGVAPTIDAPPRDFSAGKRTVIAEVQRQVSSCPVLFAWDGASFRFVSDLLGVGGMGYLVAPGEYAPPRPWENFLMPAGLPAEREGRLEVKLAEPMEEACYLDEAALAAYDLPPGWRMVLDERMGILGPEPTGEAIFYRREVVPVRAVNDRGEDVTGPVIEADHVAAPVGPLDERFLGRLERDHVLAIELAEPIETAGARPVLVAHGWIEYPYSQTMFAAWQAGADYRAPTLEARVGADGPWTLVAEQFGYPAGMPRVMALPLDGLPEGATALRLSTNQEVYWDRLSVVYAEPCAGATRRELELLEATMRRGGFARRTTGPQRLPHYDDDDRSPFWDTRHMAGLYTAFGPVTALLAAHDDALAIFGPGEEVLLSFAAPGQPPPPGWTRRMVLRTRGWCKDMDLFTADGETVGPLPSSSDDPDRALHDQYNTRFEHGR